MISQKKTMHRVKKTARPKGQSDTFVTHQLLHKDSDFSTHDTVAIVTFGYCGSSMGGCNLKREQREKSSPLSGENKSLFQPS